jgi:hypothetical protein
MKGRDEPFPSTLFISTTKEHLLSIDSVHSGAFPDVGIGYSVHSVAIPDYDYDILLQGGMFQR